MAHSFKLKIRTRLSFEELDNVLGQYCQSTYGIAIGGLDDTSAIRKKIMILSFDKVEDRDRLKALFAARSAKSMRGAQPANAADPAAA
jgi:hypothetical protein